MRSGRLLCEIRKGMGDQGNHRGRSWRIMKKVRGHVEDQIQGGHREIKEAMREIREAMREIREVISYGGIRP